MRKRWHLPRIGRDSVSYLAGLTILMHEAFIPARTPNPYLLPAALVLMGLPQAFKIGNKLGTGNSEKPDSKGYYRVPRDAESDR